jgi:predicted nucleotidyltransferase
MISGTEPHDYQPLIDRFVAACRDDDRVVAALLYGSQARGTADASSDLDLGLVTTDASHDDFVASREAFVRSLGEALFVEDFDDPGEVYAIYSDGAEAEIILSRESQLDRHGGVSKVLLDKRGLFAGRTDVATAPRAEPRVEEIRRQIHWFWHDVSHFIVAMGRGHLWWAYGQLDNLRLYCLNLARLLQDPAAEAEGYWKVDGGAVAAEHLAVLEATVSPRERQAMLRAAQVIVSLYRELAHSLAEVRGIPYPTELDRIMSERLAKLDSGQ